MRLIAIFIATAVSSAQWSSGSAALYDNHYLQRIAVTRSTGDLSKNPGHLSYQANLAKTYASYPSLYGIDLYHELGVFLDSFKTRGSGRLLFPFTPESIARVIEPSVSLGTCLFAQSPVQLCASVGLSLAHIQTTIKNYQMYGGFPANMGLVWKPMQSPWTMELGARYRTLRNRIDGFVSTHQDISYSLGIGYVSNSI